ncbi:hypothetical protein NDU88_002657 [Pleurodeles waltl]|uniref:MICOS complex subunit n=1 Tax=Pleurodeles waltl TaxID=8319 RepID=A0AAV7VF17_PLEWA|nr:hypothetical protein NDU88_002657 [Pleurodeles waltl]
MATKIIKLSAVPVGLVGLVTLRIYAANQEHLGESHLLTPSQLSIYRAPPQQSKYIEEQPGTLQLTLSIVRNTIHPYAALFKRAYLSIENGICRTIQFGKDSYVYLKNPPPEFLPKVGVITVSGLSGLVLARKGSRFKKIVYPLGLTTLGVSVCYPAQTIIFAKVAGKKVYTASHWSYETLGSLWRPTPSSGKGSLERNEDYTHGPEPVLERELQETKMHVPVTVEEIYSQPQEITEVSASLGEPSKTTIDTSVGLSESEIPSQTLKQDDVKKETLKLDPKLLDHGQSNPEDSDMYSTRS